MKKITYIGIFILAIFLVGLLHAEMLISDAGVEYDSEILDKFNDFEKVNIFFKLDNMSDTDTFLNIFSENEFTLIRKSSTRIVGDITLKGSNKLISDNRTDIVYYNAPVYINNNASVEYDSEIIEKFNENNQTELRLVIHLKDESGINITGSKEERRNLSRQVDEWFQPRIDEVLADYNLSDIKLFRRSVRGFSADVSKEGFDKLINDPRVSDIYLDKPVYIGGEQGNNSVNYSEIEKNESEVIIDEIKERNNSSSIYIKILIIILLIILMLWIFLRKMLTKNS